MPVEPRSFCASTWRQRPKPSCIAAGIFCSTNWRPANKRLDRGILLGVDLHGKVFDLFSRREHDLVGRFGRNMYDIASMEGLFLAARNAGAANFSGCGGLPSLHRAAEDDVTRTVADDDNVRLVLMKLRLAGGLAMHNHD